MEKKTLLENTISHLPIETAAICMLLGACFQIKRSGNRFQIYQQNENVDPKLVDNYGLRMFTVTLRVASKVCFTMFYSCFKQMIEHCHFLKIPSILDQEMLLFWKDTFEMKGKTCFVRYDTASYKSYSENKVSF